MKIKKINKSLKLSQPKTRNQENQAFEFKSKLFHSSPVDILGSVLEYFPYKHRNIFC